MTDVLILLAPVFLLVIMLWFGFTGCGKLLPPEPEPTPTPTPPPPPAPPPTPPAKPYNKHIEETDGFLVLWPLNETSGIKAAATSAILNLDGEYKPGATPGSDGAFILKEPGANFAPTLNGTTGYIEVPFNVQLNPATNPIRFSVELWAKPAGAIPAGEEQILVSSHHLSATGNNRGYEIALVGGAAGNATVRGRVFHVNDGATVVDVTLAAGDPLAWRHIVLTYDGPASALRVYGTVTGTPFDSTPHESAGNYSSVQAGGQGERPLRFGAGHLQAGGPEKFFAGRIDEVAFYQVVLLPGIVKQHFELF